MSDASKNLSTSVEHLKKTGGLSQEAANLLLVGPDRSVNVPDISHVEEDTIWAAFLIDGSGSMSSYRNEVVKHHVDMIEPLRGSAKCRHGSLFVSQCLFNSDITELHPFLQLSPDPSASDGVIILNFSSYNPNDGTALYDTVHKAIQDLAVIVDVCRSNGVTSKFIIAVLTDGEDTTSHLVSSGDVKALMDELRSKRLIHNSIVVGLTSGSFGKYNVEQIRDDLGFDSFACCGSDNPKAIREAFLLMSQSVAALAAKP